MTRRERLEGTSTSTSCASRIKDELCASDPWFNDGTYSSAIKRKSASIDVTAHVRNSFGFKEEVEEDWVARKRSETTAEERYDEIEVVASKLICKQSSSEKTAICLQGTSQTAKEYRRSSIATTQSNTGPSHLKYEGNGSTSANLPPKSSDATYKSTKRKFDATDGRSVGRVRQAKRLRDKGYGRNGVERIGLTHPKVGWITSDEHPTQVRRPLASGVLHTDHHLSGLDTQPAITRVARVHPTEVNTEREHMRERNRRISRLLDWQLEESWKRLEDQTGLQRTELDKRVKQAGIQLERKLKERLPQLEQQLRRANRRLEQQLEARRPQFEEQMRQANERLEQQLEAQRPQFEEQMRQANLWLDRKLDAASRNLDERLEQEILRLEGKMGI
ncbi:hypothetical protein G7Y79_00018g045860 [Physcia stellaris]|nr:hypothetical protein G7Y79_00018g045860 [Physcia stellaris]